MKKISIIAPVYNEGKNIAKFIAAVGDVFSGLDYQYEIILVDDGSRDNSWRNIVDENSKKSHVIGIKLAKNFGKEGAIAAGIAAASGDALVTIDCDLQHPPQLIGEMVQKWMNGADIVIGVKLERQKESFFDRLMARGFYKLFKWVTDTDISTASDFILLDRRVADILRAMPEKLFFYRGVVHWLGFKQETISFTPVDRLDGTSGWSFFKKIRLGLDSLTGFSAKPLMLIWVMLGLFAIFAFIVAGDALISKIMGLSVSGFSTLVFVVLITGIAILSSLCLLSIYIRQIFYEIKSRPRFIIETRLDQDKGSSKEKRR